MHCWFLLCFKKIAIVWNIRRWEVSWIEKISIKEKCVIELMFKLFKIQQNFYGNSLTSLHNILLQVSHPVFSILFGSLLLLPSDFYTIKQTENGARQLQNIIIFSYHDHKRIIPEVTVKTVVSVMLILSLQKTNCYETFIRNAELLRRTSDMFLVSIGCF